MEANNKKDEETTIDENYNDENNTNKQWEDYERIDEMECKMKKSNKTLYQRRKINMDNFVSLFGGRSSKGLCGLQNLGNTCFMNSAIQCVSHSIELTNFFLTKAYEQEINSSNKLSLKGKLANVWYKLLVDLWIDNNRSTAPKDFKYTIARIASQFSGYGQQDSHELLTFLLDGLHEDLNKISIKPYREIAEKEITEEDESAARRFWDLHLERNDSVIVDLFNGQYKSTITCPECHRVSITYDPYTTVPIPIPRLKKVDVYFVPQLNIKKTLKISIFISQDALFWDIAHYINSNLEEKIGKFRCMIVTNNECLKMVKASDNIIDASEKGFIFCCEINPKILKSKSEYYNLPVHLKKGEELISYPRMFTVNNEITMKDFRISIYGFMRRYFDLPEKMNKFLKNKYNTLIEEHGIGVNNSNIKDDQYKYYEEYEKIVKEEYELIFNDQLNNDQDDELRKEIHDFKSNLPFSLYLINTASKINKRENIDKNDKITIFKKISNSEIESKITNISLEDSKKSENENNMTSCIISLLDSLDDSQSLKPIIDLYKSGYKIYLEFCDDEISNSLFKPEKLKSLKTCMNIASKEKSKQLNLNDCLEHFRLTEKLGKNNEWYCKDCKKHQQAFKKLELFYTPKVLILHLKRFEYSSMGRYRTYAEKIGSNIDFPLDDLELSQHIVGPDSNAKYELYAVSQHYGSCGGGHYTAVCKNNGKWYDFNDSSVSPTSESSVVNSAAYLLFYRRKEN